MRDAVRRLFSVRPSTRIVQVRVPAIIAGRRGLPVLLSAFAVIAAASTSPSTSAAADRELVAAPAGTTVLPPAAPPTYSYPSTVGSQTAGGATPPTGTGLSGNDPGGAVTASQLAAGGIPARAVQAYQEAAVASGCGITWTLVAAIGRVESDHGRFGGATLLSDGRSNPPIVGIPLDGRAGVALIKDTDHGRYDGDTRYDRAVGPMQFIPSSWALFGVDGDGDGKADPFDIDDASAAAAKYLCKAGGGDLTTEAAQRNAVYSYNRSVAYVDNVMALAAVYAGGAPVDNSPAPNGTPGGIPPLKTPTLPRVSVGDPLAGPPNTSTPAGPAAPTPRPSTPTTSAPSTAHPTTTAPGTPSSSATSTQPSTPPPSSSSPSATPSPTCTPVPSASPSSSGSITPNGTGTVAGTAAAGTAEAAADGTAADGTAAETAAATPAGSASAAATPTGSASPSPTLPPCPS
jgi:hypothetical protein